MPLDIPTLEDVFNRTKTDVKNSLPESNPFLLNAQMLALIFGFSGRAHDNYLSQKELIKQIFPDTATGEFLERWASIYGITRNPATQSKGEITVTGIVSSIVPIGTMDDTIPVTVISPFDCVAGFLVIPYIEAHLSKNSPVAVSGNICLINSFWER